MSEHYSRRVTIERVVKRDDGSPSAEAIEVEAFQDGATVLRVADGGKTTEFRLDAAETKCLLGAFGK